jgi:hypothetical protein
MKEYWMDVSALFVKKGLQNVVFAGIEAPDLRYYPFVLAP